MALTPSTMPELGTRPPTFRLPDTRARPSRSTTLRCPALLVIFLCNHCPYVKHVRRAGEARGSTTSAGVAVVGISSNDVTTIPRTARN